MWLKFIYLSIKALLIIFIAVSGIAHIIDGDVTNGLLMLILAKLIDGDLRD